VGPYRGLQPIDGPTPMGHEYCGIVEEVGSAVKLIKPGQFVVGSFATSDNTCPHCLYGYQSVMRAPRVHEPGASARRDAGADAGHSIGAAVAAVVTRA
jgi:threonine dehydrogenase-like Zn-dependent dehydrogenase